MSPSFSNNYSTNHTIYLQDGTLFNFKKRCKKHLKTLISAFIEVEDGRSKFGRRYSLPLILIILFGGITAGNTTIKDCHLWALHDRKWLEKVVGLEYGLEHGLPNATTISRAIQKVDPNSLVQAYITWENILYGFSTVFSSGIASFDGKTMRGVHGDKEITRHILSLFSHQTNQILGQVGVEQKENEISALPRLLEQTQAHLAGMLLLGDALHTQKETVKKILEHKAGYLLFAKGNQELLEAELATFFNNLPFKSAIDQTYYEDNERERNILSEVTTSQDNQMCQYLIEQCGWEGVKTVGSIKRSGTRKSAEGRLIPVNEIVYLISSRQLTAIKAAKVSRGHWCIENNLHWQKDYTFLEDRQTLRVGSAPQVMTFLRSMCISLFNLWQIDSLTETVNNFKNSKVHHHGFLRMSGVI